MIQFLGVSKIYPNQYRALDNINLEIAEGEFLFLIGPSGSGKTTIIRHLIREETPSEGKIYFDDEEITKFKRKHVYELRRKIGVVFQDFKLIHDKNAYENIAFAMEAAGKSPKDISETVPYVLDIVGLLHRASAFPEQLSGGEKQRVAIARAISNNPKLLIADEPTGNLDPDAAWDIVQILSKINNWGTTVIMATHGSEIVDALAKRVITLENGQILQDVLKGSYRNAEVQIAQEKRKQEKEKAKEKIKIEESKQAKEAESPKEKKESVKDAEKIEGKQSEVEVKKEKVDEEESHKEVGKTDETESPKQEEKIEKPKSVKKSEKMEVKDATPVTLTDRRKARDITNAGFESLVTASLEPFRKKKKIAPDTDLKKLDLNPKLTSILKAFGYNTFKDLKEAGFKKISKIDELSSKDLKKLKKLINTNYQ